MENSTLFQSPYIQELSVSLAKLVYKFGSDIVLQVSIPKFEEKVSNQKPVVFYLVKVILGRREWTLEKRYSEFSKLDSELRVKYPKLPVLPGKTWFKLKGSENVEKRQIELDGYLKDIGNRSDMRTNLSFREFLELDTQIPESVCYSPIKSSELSDLYLGGRDFIFVEKRGLLFVAMSEMKISSRLGSYMDNITMPWEQKTDQFSIVGAVCAYKVKIDPDTDTWEFLRVSQINSKGSFQLLLQLWTKTFATQTNVMWWCNKLELLFIGLDSGTIHVLKVPQKHKYLRFEDVSFSQPLGTKTVLRRRSLILPKAHELKAHSKRVMGVAFERKLGYVYSIGEDGKFKISDINTESLVNEMTPGKSGLKCMVYEKEHARILMGDDDGVVFVYSVMTYPPELQVAIQIQSKTCIRFLSPDRYSNFLFAVAIDGSLTILELGKPGKVGQVRPFPHLQIYNPTLKDRFMKQVSMLQGKPGCRIVRWRDQNREIFTANQDGFVTFWSAKTGEPLYVWQAHSGPITQMIFNEEKQQVITCGKDKKLCIWQLPKVWMDEEKIKAEVREVLATEEKKQKLSYPHEDSNGSTKGSNQTTHSNSGVKSNIDPSNDDKEEDDDLTGWNT